MREREIIRKKEEKELIINNFLKVFELNIVSKLIATT